VLKHLLMQLREAMARPFRDAARVNREVLFEYLRDLRGTFLENGLGSACLINMAELGGLQSLAASWPSIFHITGCSQSCWRRSKIGEAAIGARGTPGMQLC